MVKGFSLIITPIFNFKDFYLVYNDSNTKIYFCYRWFQIFVTDGSIKSMDNGLTYFLYELDFFHRNMLLYVICINITVFLAI